jgi:hypothetical protein
VPVSPVAEECSASRPAEAKRRSRKIDGHRAIPGTRSRHRYGHDTAAVTPRHVIRRHIARQPGRWVALIAPFVSSERRSTGGRCRLQSPLYNPGAGAVHAIYATGNVEPSVMVPIAARTAARLVELKAYEGDVKQRQLHARLENDDLRRAIDMA